MIPKHVALILDGNRRWAKENGMAKVLTYNNSGNYYNVKSLCAEAKLLGVEYFSLWAFSTENWKRDKKEIREIFDVILRGVDLFLENADINKYKFKHLGRKNKIPDNLRKKLCDLENVTSSYTDFMVLLGVDYGGRDEITRAINKILRSGKTKIKEEDIPNYLDTKGVPDPSLIIRTGGDKRLSGFMPFQSTYAEISFTKCYFPDFKPPQLREIIEEFSKHKRRFGGD